MGNDASVQDVSEMMSECSCLMVSVHLCLQCGETSDGAAQADPPPSTSAAAALQLPAGHTGTESTYMIPFKSG